MYKLILKGCPRCGGDLFPDEHEMYCFQCGNRLYDKEPLKLIRAGFGPGSKKKVKVV